MRVRVLSIGVATVIAVVSITIAAIVSGYRDTTRRVEHELRTVALGLAAHTTVYIRGATYLLDELQAATAESGQLGGARSWEDGNRDHVAALVKQLHTAPHVFENFGVMAGSSIITPATLKIECIPQSLIFEHKRTPDSTVRISATRCSEGNVRLHLTRSIQDGKGKFLGMAFVSLDANFFIEYLRNTQFDTPALLTIYSGDRQILEARLERDSTSFAAMPDAAISGSGSAITATKLRESSLRIALQPSVENLPAAWWRSLVLDLAAMLFILSGIIAIITLLLHSRKQHQLALIDLAELQTLKRQAEAANHAKSEYLAIMSHEIRTSMSGVLGMAEFMLRSKLYKEQHSGVKVLYDAGQNLVQIINKVLDFSKIESGTLELAEVSFEPGELIARVGDLFAKEAYNKGISLEIFRPSKPVWVCGDDLRIRQILANFIGNALKFTKQGGVSISLKTEVLAGTGDRVRLLYKVRDTGPGIAAGMQDRLFQPFHQARNEATREVPGTGLGLSICKRLSDLMDGKIWVDSSEGIGSTFYLQIDCASAQSTQQVPNPATPESYDVPPGLASILLVEDNLSNQEIAKKYLERDGYTVRCANDGAQAVELFKTERFDIILMDGSMPVMDGYEATQRIRLVEAQENRKRTPIIATTANTGEENERKCLAAGMDDFVPKPYRFSDLRVKIAKWAL